MRMMNKLLDIALKDLRRAFRSRFLLVFTFVIPVLVTALFALMFGEVGGDEEPFSLPPTTVRVANLDRGRLAVMPAATGLEGAALAGVDSMGALLVRLLQSDRFAELVIITEAADATAARVAVDDGESDVALIIPPTLTDALTEPDIVAGIELYHDPTLTLEPQVVETLVAQIVEQLAVPKLAAETAVSQLASTGITPDPALVAEVVAAAGQTAAAVDSQNLLEQHSPPGSEAEDVAPLAQILGPIMGGMLVFYAFYTGAVSMQTLITETEEGTLPRLFTTPTLPAVVLGGRVLATSLMLIVQVAVLLLFGWLVFDIGWGAPLPTLLAALAVILAAAATGLFIVSLLRTTRQAGIVFGGVLTLTGMVGLLPVFTVGSGGNRIVEAAALLVPQGWAMRALQLSMEGGRPADLSSVLGGVLLWSAVLGLVGLYRLRRRFA